MAKVRTIKATVPKVKAPKINLVKMGTPMKIGNIISKLSRSKVSGLFKRKAGIK